LELPYKPKDRYTWLTPFDKAWQLRFQATLNHGAFAHHAARLLAKHDQAHVLAEFTAYINRTDLDYISWPKFASGFGAWGTARRSGKGRDGLNTGNIDSVWDGNI
jgi:hypothetical protein